MHEFTFIYACFTDLESEAIPSAKDYRLDMGKDPSVLFMKGKTYFNGIYTVVHLYNRFHWKSVKKLVNDTHRSIDFSIEREGGVWVGEE